MKERWADIREFPDYAISDQGTVVSKNRDLVMRSSVNQQGIAYIRFGDKGVQRSRAIAPLVAEAFLPIHPNPRCDTPMHLNGNQTDCHIDNLVWRPRWYVIEYHRQFKPDFRFRDFPYPVYCSDTDEVFTDIWELTMKFGLVQKRLRFAINNNMTVFPDNLKFEYIYDEE